MHKYVIRVFFFFFFHWLQSIWIYILFSQVVKFRSLCQPAGTSIAFIEKTLMSIIIIFIKYWVYFLLS